MNVKRETTRIHFTEKNLNRLPVPDEGRATYYDDQTRGFGIKIEAGKEGRPTSKNFFWFRRVNGAGKWKTIGPFPDMTIDDARGKADEYNSKLAKGEQPFDPDRGALTLGDVLDDYIDKHLSVEAKNADKAKKHTRWQFDRYLSSWKERKLASIHPEDVDALRHKITSGKVKAGPASSTVPGRTTSNRVVGLLRTLFNWAIAKQGFKGTNPTDGKFFKKGKSRMRFIQPDEMPTFFKALKAETNVDLRDFVMLSVFTGARRGDVVSMRWDHLSKTVKGQRQWMIPDPKNGETYVVPLTDEAVKVLNGRKHYAETSEWVFPSDSESGHVVDFKKAWKRFCTRAKLSDLRIHDLRRTLGSWQACLGTSLVIIGKSLGHSSTDATAVYSRLTTDPVRDSITMAGRAMLQAGRRKLLAASNE